MCLKVYFESCFVFTLWALEPLAFMDRFDMCLKTTFLICIVFTMRTLKLLAYMDCFYCGLIVGIGTLDLHGLILCVSEGSLSELLRSHTVCKETLDLHGLILCVSEVQL